MVEELGIPNVHARKAVEYVGNRLGVAVRGRERARGRRHVREHARLVEAAFGNQNALTALVKSIGYKDTVEPTALNETIIMLVVLALIDVVMISNLLIMVIVGGYETFVSRMGLQSHPDQPEWLSHVNASVLKVKLATAIIGISSIHLLKTFINAANYEEKVLMYQTIIHVVFLLSAMAIAYTDRLMSSPKAGKGH